MGSIFASSRDYHIKYPPLGHVRARCLLLISGFIRKHNTRLCNDLIHLLIKYLYHQYSWTTEDYDYLWIIKENELIKHATDFMNPRWAYCTANWIKHGSVYQYYLQIIRLQKNILISVIPSNRDSKKELIVKFSRPHSRKIFSNLLIKIQVDYKEGICTMGKIQEHCEDTAVFKIDTLESYMLRVGMFCHGDSIRLLNSNLKLPIQAYQKTIKV